MLRLITPPAVEPVTLEAAKAHLRVDGSDEDALITSLVVAAREHCEAITARAFAAQTWECSADEFPAGDLRLPRPPLQSVSAITYKDESGTVNTLDSGDYVVDTSSEPGRVIPAPGRSWPTASLYPGGAVVVQYIAGYGTAGDVPQAIKHAILLLVGHWFEQREAVNVGNAVSMLPLAYEALLWPYRAWWY